jgi:hypothetical protein
VRTSKLCRAENEEPARLSGAGGAAKRTSIDRILPRRQRGASILYSLAAGSGEAVREYLHTGREVHRSAFERHMGGMLLRMRKDRA